MMRFAVLATAITALLFHSLDGALGFPTSSNTEKTFFFSTCEAIAKVLSPSSQVYYPGVYFMPIAYMFS